MSKLTEEEIAGIRARYKAGRCRCLFQGSVPHGWAEDCPNWDWLDSVSLGPFLAHIEALEEEIGRLKSPDLRMVYAFESGMETGALSMRERFKSELKSIRHLDDKMSQKFINWACRVIDALPLTDEGTTEEKDR